MQETHQYTTQTTQETYSKSNGNKVSRELRSKMGSNGDEQLHCANQIYIQTPVLSPVLFHSLFSLSLFISPNPLSPSYFFTDIVVAYNRLICRCFVCCCCSPLPPLLKVVRICNDWMQREKMKFQFKGAQCSKTTVHFIK